VTGNKALTKYRSKAGSLYLVKFVLMIFALLYHFHSYAFFELEEQRHGMQVGPNTCLSNPCQLSM